VAGRPGGDGRAVRRSRPDARDARDGGDARDAQARHRRAARRGRRGAGELTAPVDPIAEIERARSARLVDEDGRDVALVVDPPLRASAVEALERELGVALPAELRALLAFSGGLGGVLDLVRFGGGRGLDVATDELFPAGLPLAADGFGNFWVADVTPAQRDVAPVYFLCHDAPVLLYQAPSVGHFLHELFRMYEPPHASLVDDVHEDRLFRVWRENPGAVEQAAAAASDDEVLAAFAATLDERFVVVDLRAAPVGMGFSWGRFGPRTEVRRHGFERVFAYRRPDRRPGLRARFSPRRA
jgi:cell wall assembly regulator SMI1